MRIAFFGDSLIEGNLGASFLTLLREKFPQHTLINYGEGGDTVVSLHQRMKGIPMDGPMDLAVLWVGVNEVFGNIHWSYRLINVLRKKPTAKDNSEFESYYRRILEFLGKHARRTFTLPPLLLGENPESMYNNKLAQLSEIIRNLSSCYENAEYIDLRASFLQALSTKRTSDYLPTSFLGIVRDALSLHSLEQVDRKSSERGLFFTLDGVHLNRTGAEMVSNQLAEHIEGLAFSYVSN